MQDADVPAWWRVLGLPGLFDVHVHFMPPRVQAKVWEQFDSAGPLIGRPWPIHYRGSDEERVDKLRSLGVRRFSALSYAHRPGMAEWLNDWAGDFADRVPGCLRSATFFPERGVDQYVAQRVAAGVEVFKVHVQVGAFDVRDPLLDEAWGLLAEAGTPVVLHAGSGPVPGEFTGPAPVRALLERHPRLRLVIAHLGMPEYADFLALAERVPARPPRHDDRVHRLLRGGVAVPGRAAAAARRTAGPRAAGVGLPEHPASLRPPARGTRTARAGGGLAPGGVLGERCPAVRRLISTGPQRPFPGTPRLW